MRLYFMRHAQALNVGDWGGADAARPLTDEGRTRAAQAAAGLARIHPGIEAIISSPYVRAYETALITGHALGLTVATSDALRPGFSLASLDVALALRPDVGGVLFVGHEPDMSGVVLALAGNADVRSVTMKKGSCAFIQSPVDVEGGASAEELAGKCSLVWVRTWRELATLRAE